MTIVAIGLAKEEIVLSQRELNPLDAHSADPMLCVEFVVCARQKVTHGGQPALPQRRVQVLGERQRFDEQAFDFHWGHGKRRNVMMSIRVASPTSCAFHQAPLLLLPFSCHDRHQSGPFPAHTPLSALIFCA
jgi:hypothetical protein